MERVDLRVRVLEVPDAEVPRMRVEGPDLPATELHGCVLEAAFRTRAGTLVLTTDDCFHEEALHISLLAPGGGWRDAYRIMHLYAPGVVGHIETGADGLALSFHHRHRDVEIALRPRPRLAPPGAQPISTVRTMAPWKRAWLGITRPGARNDPGKPPVTDDLAKAREAS